MSNINEGFIFTLADRIADNVVRCKNCRTGITINTKELRNSINQSLGENARRMLEIGILQDELVKMGFKSGIKTISTWNIDNEDKRLFLSIYFDNDVIEVVNFNGEVVARFSYDSPTWQEDVLNKVKELINE